MFTNHVEMRYNVTNKLPIAPLVAPLDDDNDSVSVSPEVQYLQYDMVTNLLNCTYLVPTAYPGAYVREYCTYIRPGFKVYSTTTVLVCTE